MRGWNLGIDRIPRRRHLNKHGEETVHLPTGQAKKEVPNKSRREPCPPNKSETVACQNLTLPTLPPGGGGGAHPGGGRRLAVRRVLEERPRKALVGVPDVEENDPWFLILYEYALDGEPDEELLLREALHAAERALAEVATHHVVEVGQVAVVVFGVARRRQPRLQQTARFVQGVRLHAAREQSSGKAVIFKKLMYRVACAGEGDAAPRRGAGGQCRPRRGEQEKDAHEREHGGRAG